MSAGAKKFPWQPGDLWIGRAMIAAACIKDDCEPGELVEKTVVYDPERGEGLILNNRTGRPEWAGLKPINFTWKHDKPLTVTRAGLGAVVNQVMTRELYIRRLTA
jgi:hypothetical protein